MTNSFLDKAGLTYLWSKITALVNTKQNTLTFDSTPTANSTNPVTSAGIKAYVDANAGGDVPVENGTGAGSVQSKQFVFDHDDDGEDSTFVQAATGDASFAVGAGTTASGMYSHAEGLFTTAYGNRSHAEGDNTLAGGTNSHVEGEYTIARGDNQHVSGKYNIEDMDEEYAEIVGNGESTSARSNARTLDWDGNAWYAGVVSSNAYPNDIVSDDDALTTTEAVHQILDEELPVETGTDIGASATYPGAIQTKAFTSGGHTYHQYAMAMGAASFGLECQAVAAGSFAEGSGTEAGGLYSHAEGQGTHATGQQSHAEGIGSTADGRSSHAEGSNTTANSTGAHSEGSSTIADGNASHAEGTDTKAQGSYSHSEGEDTYAMGEAAHAEGWRTIAQTYAHSEGRGSTATLTLTSDPNGYNTVYTCASIPQTIRRGMYIKYYDGQGIDAFIPITNVDRTNNKITVINNTLGTLSNTTVTVYLSSAYGQGSHIEGSGCAAYGNYAHAEGSSTRADGINAHAEGYLSEANNSQTHAEGHGTIANAIAQHVEGKFNIADTTSAHIVGNGSNNNNRSNAYTLDWNGNAWFAGSITLHDSQGDVTITAAQLRSLLALI